LTEHERQTVESGFFERWSRRKAGRRQGELLPDEPEGLSDPDLPGEQTDAQPQREEAPVRIDARTGKPFDELTDADMPDVESLSQDSDVSMFLARNISPTLRRQALRKLFHMPKFNKVSLCAEYAGDYTTWQPIGDVVPHDWKRAITREAERARQKLAAMDEAQGESETTAEAADRQGSPQSEEQTVAQSRRAGAPRDGGQTGDPDE